MKIEQGGQKGGELIEAKGQFLHETLTHFEEKFSEWQNSVPSRGDWEGLVKGVDSLAVDLGLLRQEVQGNAPLWGEVRDEMQAMRLHLAG